MLSRGFICAALALVAACAPIGQGKQATGEKSIFGSGDRPSADKLLFNEPMPVRVRTWVMSTWFRESEPASACTRALPGAAETGSYNSQAYDEYAKNRLKELKVAVDDKAPMTLWFDLQVTDVPSALVDGAPTIFCLVQFETRLSGKGEQRLNWKPEIKFRSDVSIYNWNEISFVRPQKLHSVMLKKIDDQIKLMAPTLNGKIKDSCGYFLERPFLACAVTYWMVRDVYKERLRCASSKEEAGKWRKLLADVEEKLKEYPPEPPMEPVAPLTGTTKGTDSTELGPDGCPMKPNKKGAAKGAKTD